jgi:beta-N-acetylhexosaminidase
MVGFPGTTLPADLAKRIAEGRVGGIALFRRNVESPEQLRTLLSDIYSHAPKGNPPLIALDQEGGRVQRLREPWTRWPAMAQVAERATPEQLEQLAAALATECKDAGFSLNFAPVVDVNSNPDNPVIGDRAFGIEPVGVSEHTARFVRAHQEAGLAACAKHFPGHGDADVDSHLDLPTLDHDLDRLRKIDWPPFKAVIDAEVASIMSAHILFTKLDAKRPATMSPEVMGLLRSELEYDGLVITDDLEMGAIAKHYGPRDRALLPLEAGCDVVLVCHSADLREEMLGYLEKAADTVVERSLERLIAFKKKWAMEAVPTVVGGPPYAEHLALAEALGWSSPSTKDPTQYKG